MYKLILSICTIAIVLSGCTDAERESTVDTITYSDTEVTVLFKDGLIITTDRYDYGIQSGDIVYVKHLKNGDVVITKYKEEK